MNIMAKKLTALLMAVLIAAGLVSLFGPVHVPSHA